MLDPGGYPPRYALMIASHRVLRYAAPFLHVVLLAASLLRRPRAGRLERALLAAQLLLLAGAAAGGRVRLRPLLVARYYVLTQASIAMGLWDWLRHGTPAGWSAPEGRVTMTVDRVRSRRAPFDGRRARSWSRRRRSSRPRRCSPSPRSRSAWSRAATCSTASGGSGMDGREFDVLKLRTMVTGAETMGAGLAVDEGDPRITRVGALLRRTSIDELPNLVNVLRGEMAIVGPRPTVPVQVAQYTDRQRGRLAVRPGITGWAQVNGRASLPWHERIELDLWYVEHRSWRLDLEIIARTARLVVGGDGLYKGETGGWRKT